MIRLTVSIIVAVAIGVACRTGTGAGELVGGVALAGPTCPVVSDPPDLACEDRPVEGAEIVVMEAGGHEVARARTDASGRFAISLPAGEYQLVLQPVEGLLGTPGTVELVVVDGVVPDPLTIAYDTGIR